MSIKIYSMAEMQRLLREGSFPINGPILQGDNNADALSDSDQTITNASIWDLVITPTTSRTLKFDNSFSEGDSRTLTNASQSLSGGGSVVILTANDDSEIGRLQPGETTTLKCISGSPADNEDWGVLGPGAWPAFKVQLSSAQNFDGSSSKVQFDDVIFDRGNNYDETTNYRFTVPSSGVYSISASAFTTNHTGANDLFLQIFKNGSALKRIDVPLPIDGSDTKSGMISLTDEASKDDYYEVFTQSGLDGTPDTDYDFLSSSSGELTEFWGHRIR